ncbi:hypothetical protein CFP56_027748 [Quercus suber]|uniref:Uncharacterized protein n=1 Tax=Quercus suber TaxID=58331 RepID=A0AAW0JW69_QUESU
MEKGSDPGQFVMAVLEDFRDSIKVPEILQHTNCPGSLPFSITHAKVLYRLVRYSEALETCNSALSIPTSINYDSKKELRVLKGKIMKRQDAMYLATVKHEIQVLQ